MNGNPGAYLEGMRDRKNKDTTPNRTQRRREKADFADFVTKAGARAPRTHALVSQGVAHKTASGPKAVAVFLSEAPEGDYFCKPNGGRNGIGAFRLTLTANSPMIDGEPSSIASVAERLSSEDYVLQEWMTPLQHPDIARFRDSVINTMRLVTFDAESAPKPAAGSLRMAISLKSIDSWTQGGVVAAIDLERGVLKPFGILKKGLKIVDSHPGSGVAFRDQPIPHFHDAVAIACKLHSQLDRPKSIGWDIALLADGPCFLEANGPWDILMSAQFNPELVPAFLAFHLPEPSERAVRVDMTGSFTDATATCRKLSRAVGVAMASGRMEHLEPEHLSFTVGGTQKAVQIAIQVIKAVAPGIGAQHERCANRGTACPRVRRLGGALTYWIRPPGFRPLGRRDGIVLSKESSLSASRNAMISSASSSGSSSRRASGSTSRRRTYGFSGRSS
jgi:hypothetical protein